MAMERQPDMKPVSRMVQMALSNFSPSGLFFFFVSIRKKKRHLFFVLILRITNQISASFNAALTFRLSVLSKMVKNPSGTVVNHCHVNMLRNSKNISNIYLIYYFVLFLSEEPDSYDRFFSKQLRVKNLPERNIKRLLLSG